MTSIEVQKVDLWRKVQLFVVRYLTWLVMAAMLPAVWLTTAKFRCGFGAELEQVGTVWVACAVAALVLSGVAHAAIAEWELQYKIALAREEVLDQAAFALEVAFKAVELHASPRMRSELAKHQERNLLNQDDIAAAKGRIEGALPQIEGAAKKVLLVSYVLEGVFVVLGTLLTGYGAELLAFICVP